MGKVILSEFIQNAVEDNAVSTGSLNEARPVVRVVVDVHLESCSLTSRTFWMGFHGT